MPVLQPDSYYEHSRIVSTVAADRSDASLHDNCQEVAGSVVPVVDRNRCEGKEDCLRVCPYNVFAIQVLGSGERKNLSFRGKIKAWAHGGRQAFVVNPDACHACALCVTACPEKALTLKKRESV